MLPTSFSVCLSHFNIYERAMSVCTVAEENHRFQGHIFDQNRVHRLTTDSVA